MLSYLTETENYCMIRVIVNEIIIFILTVRRELIDWRHWLPPEVHESSSKSGFLLTRGALHLCDIIFV